MIRLETFVELAQEQMTDYNEPIQYSTILPVIKESTISTKVRVVSNSAIHSSRTGRPHAVMEDSPDSRHLRPDQSLLAGVPQGECAKPKESSVETIPRPPMDHLWLL